MTNLELRPAIAEDIVAVAGIFARARAGALPFLPVLHSPEEDIAFFAGYLERGRITLAQAGVEIFGFIAETPGWIEQLYLEPARWHGGIGTRMVDDVKSRQKNLRLWCFAENAAALRFYGRQGFVEIGATDGDNAEGRPDVLLAWEG